MRRLLPYLSVIVVIALALLYAADRQTDHQYQTARQNYIETAKASARSDLKKLDVAMRSIYENIRTLATLPSVRTIGRHGENLSEEARITFQQIYNNLAAGVAVSEVYILPIDLEPGKIDPVTLKPEEPILMFDQLIVNAGAKMSLAERQAAPEIISATPLMGPPEVEIYEYQQFKEHATWFKLHYPTRDKINSLDVPFISGPEVITCDNTTFINTGNDADRSGILFSVPFYGTDGNIKGLVSAIILTSALRDLLPAPHFALLNPGNHYANLANGAQKMASSRTWILAAKSDPSLYYSEVIPLPVQDSRNPWFVWSGLSNESFLSSPAVLSINHTHRSNIMTIIIIALAAGISISFILKSLDQTRALNATLTESRDAAEKSEAEAHEAAATFRELNEDITILNMQLTQKAKELREAQDDTVRKAKAAQLGNLVATVAHELRNPLSVVRTTSFLLQQKLKASGVDATVQLSRIDSGIMRCDKIISQFLDFSRSQSPNKTETDVDVWLEAILNEEATKLPANFTIACNLGLQSLKANIDPERMTRVITNLLSNATEAMTCKGQPLAEMSGRPPQIDVSTRLTARGAEITVADNGPGIPSEVMEKIREPLFTTKGFGAGLGIPDVEKIVELHGGGLEISSVLGEGARFTAWFPIARRDSKAA
jgi:signal transduction histidine kinase